MPGGERSQITATIAEFADELASFDVGGGVNVEKAADREAAALARFDHTSPIMQIPLTIRVVVGSATLPVSALARIQRGALVPLDRKLGDRVDITANGRVIARGNIVLCDEVTSQYGVSVEEIAQQEPQ